MITINKQSYNTVVLTLKEKSLLTGSSYNLFVFTNEGKNQEKIFTAVDISPYRDRYNEFSIRESYTSEDLLDGKIYLEGDASQWLYTIYESSIPFSANTLSISATTGTILETGRVQVKGDEGDTSINSVYL